MRGQATLDSPIWPCSAWGLPCPLRLRRSGALLPHPFTLTPGRPGGGLLSAALSLALPRPGVTRHAACRESGPSSGCEPSGRPPPPVGARIPSKGRDSHRDCGVEPDEIGCRSRPVDAGYGIAGERARARTGSAAGRRAAAPPPGRSRCRRCENCGSPFSADGSAAEGTLPRRYRDRRAAGSDASATADRG